MRSSGFSSPAFTIPNGRFCTVSPSIFPSPQQDLAQQARKPPLMAFSMRQLRAAETFQRKNASHSAESKGSSSPVLLSARFPLLSHAGLFPAAQEKHTGTSSASSRQLLLWKRTSGWLLTPAQGVRRSSSAKSIPASAGDANTERSKEGTLRLLCAQ